MMHKKRVTTRPAAATGRAPVSAVQHLRAINAAFDSALLAHLSPMGWAHISLTGDYLWDQARKLPVDQFRPLNDPMARLKLVA